MLLLTVVLLFFGCLIASVRRGETANPFQVFFLLWFAVIAGAYVFEAKFERISYEYMAMVCLFFTVYLVAAVWWTVQAPRRKILDLGTHRIEFRPKVILILEGLTIVATPIVYGIADSLAGRSVFTIEGYIALRTAFTTELSGYGLFSYVFPLSFVLSSVNLTRYFNKRIGLVHASGSIALSVFYCYLSTGRTFFLMMICLLMFPLIITKKVKKRGILVFGLAIATCFIGVGLMTAKGLSSSGTLTENIEAALNQVRIYAVAPFVGMGRVFDQTVSLEYGKYSFRFLHVIAYRLGFTEAEPVSLVREYMLVPDPVNVFTVMDPYFRDLSYLGVFLFACASVTVHLYLYEMMRANGGVYIFLYSTLLFPLVMQVFQDMYLSSVSAILQIFFWLFLIIPRRLKGNRSEVKRRDGGFVVSAHA